MAQERQMSTLKRCAWCDVEFEPRKSTQVYCSARHRRKAFDARRRAERAGQSEPGKAGTAQNDSPVEPVSLAAQTLAELRTVGVDGTALGMGAIVLAVRIDGWSPLDPPAALQTLIKGHAEALARAKAAASAKVEGDVVDEVSRRREARRQRQAAGQ